VETRVGLVHGGPQADLPLIALRLDGAGKA